MTIRFASTCAAGPPAAIFASLRPITRCVSKPSSTASRVKPNQVLNILFAGGERLAQRALALASRSASSRARRIGILVGRRMRGLRVCFGATWTRDHVMDPDASARKLADGALVTRACPSSSRSLAGNRSTLAGCGVVGVVEPEPGSWLIRGVFAPMGDLPDQDIAPFQRDNRSQPTGQRDSAAVPACVRPYTPRSTRKNQPYTLWRSIFGASGAAVLTSDVRRGPLASEAAQASARWR